MSDAAEAADAAERPAAPDTPPARRGQGLRELALATAGLGVWGLHFTAAYMANALACARGWSATTLLGLPAVAALVLGATLLALLLLGLLLRATWPAFSPDPAEGGEREPRFLRWVGAASVLYAGVAVLLETAPALLVPPCGY